MNNDEGRKIRRQHCSILLCSALPCPLPPPSSSPPSSGLWQRAGLRSARQGMNSCKNSTIIVAAMVCMVQGSTNKPRRMDAAQPCSSSSSMMMTTPTTPSVAIGTRFWTFQLVTHKKQKAHVSPGPFPPVFLSSICFSCFFVDATMFMLQIS